MSPSVHLGLCVLSQLKFSATHIACYFEQTHPLRILWVGEHIVEAVVDVGHFHSCSKYEKNIRQHVIVFKGLEH